jgi:hypothetical protein
MVRWLTLLISAYSPHPFPDLQVCSGRERTAVAAAEASRMRDVLAHPLFQVRKGTLINEKVESQSVVVDAPLPCQV